MLRDLGRKGKYLHGAGEFLSGIFGNQCPIIREQGSADPTWVLLVDIQLLFKIHKSDHSCLDPL